MSGAVEYFASRPRDASAALPTQLRGERERQEYDILRQRDVGGIWGRSTSESEPDSFHLSTARPDLTCEPSSIAASSRLPVFRNRYGTIWTLVFSLPNEVDTWAVPRPSRKRSVWEESLDALHQLRPGWDSYDAEPPNAVAIGMANKLLRSLERLGGPSPLDIGPTVEGGVSIVFANGAHYVDVECYNTGEAILGHRFPDSSVKVAEFDPDDNFETLNLLSHHLRA